MKDYAMHLEQWKIKALLRVRGAYNQYNKLLNHPKEIIWGGFKCSYADGTLVFDSVGNPRIEIVIPNAYNHQVTLMEIDFLMT